MSSTRGVSRHNLAQKSTITHFITTTASLDHTKSKTNALKNNRIENNRIENNRIALLRLSIGSLIVLFHQIACRS
jgi:hypothetical protein